MDEDNSFNEETSNLETSTASSTENESPPCKNKRKKPFRAKHPEWKGYDEIVNDSGNIIGCVCTKCQKEFSNTYSKFMKTHR